MKAKDLRNSILQMAMQGKLVPQDPNDEPASVLLERIREEKHKLIDEGKAKFPKGGESIIYTSSDGSPYEKRVDAKGHVLSDECIADEVPFEIPDSWGWTRVESLVSLVNGKAFKPSDWTSSGLPIVRIQNLNDPKKPFNRYNGKVDCKYHLHGGELLFAWSGTPGTSFGAHIWNGGEALLNQHIFNVLFPDSCVDKHYFKLILNHQVFYLIRQAHGSAGLQHVTRGVFESIIIPIPPLAEQGRIVEHINQLMPLVEEYGELEDAREELDVTLPDRLRKSVLQMAVQGKLVEQNPDDEPTSVLLQRIRKERTKLIAEGKAKFPKGGESIIYIGSDGRHYEKRIDKKGRVLSDECIENELPFEIPKNWEWARVDDLGDWKAGATPAKTKPQYHERGTIPWLLTGDLNDSIVTNIPNKITELALKECSVRLNPIGTVLVAMYGATIGKIGVLGIPATTNQACCACILFNQEICGWLMTWLRYYKPFFIKLGEGGAQPNISREKIVSQLIPIPPLAEQHRIVERLDHILYFFTNR